MVSSKKAASAFLERLRAETRAFSNLVATSDGDWVVKGFIDVFRNVYTISDDTKVVSKIIEIMLFPHFAAFADRHNYKMVLSREQNHYPDLTFIDADGRKYAVDLKSTYSTGDGRVNTMTLGAFTGYFRNRESTKNVTFPYGEYCGHFVLGVIYKRARMRSDARRVHTLDELERIPSVVRDLAFFVQPKYRIAKDVPGSGNTKNIGAVNNVGELVGGQGPFAELGEDVFDDYWMYYMTLDMARAVELEKPPYINLKTYVEYKGKLTRK